MSGEASEGKQGAAAEVAEGRDAVAHIWNPKADAAREEPDCLSDEEDQATEDPDSGAQEEESEEEVQLEEVGEEEDVDDDIRVDPVESAFGFANAGNSPGFNSPSFRLFSPALPWTNSPTIGSPQSYMAGHAPSSPSCLGGRHSLARKEARRASSTDLNFLVDGRRAASPATCSRSSSPLIHVVRQDLARSRSASPSRTWATRVGGVTREGIGERCRGLGTVVADFRSELLKREGSYARAWRVHLDPQRKGRLTQAEFCKGAKAMGYSGKILQVWKELDADGENGITLSELDWNSAETLGRFFWTLVGRFGDLQRACSALDLKDKRKLHHDAFVGRLRVTRLASEYDAEMLFQMLQTTQVGSAAPAVTKDEVLWMGAIAGHLPKPVVGRVRPGGVTEDAETCSDEEAAGNPPASFAQEVSRMLASGAGSALEKHRKSIVSTEFASTELSEISKETPSWSSEYGDNVHDRLYHEAMKYHQRRKEYVALATTPIQPAKEITGDPKVFDRLYKDKDAIAEKRKLQEEQRKLELGPALADARKCTKKDVETGCEYYDKEAFARLIKPKERPERECTPPPDLRPTFIREDPEHPCVRLYELQKATFVPAERLAHLGPSHALLVGDRTARWEVGDIIVIRDSLHAAVNLVGPKAISGVALHKRIGPANEYTALYWGSDREASNKLLAMDAHAEGAWVFTHTRTIERAEKRSLLEAEGKDPALSPPKTERRFPNPDHIQRLYEDDARAKRKLEDLQRTARLKEEMELLAMSKPVKRPARPETFFRLYMDGVQRESQLAAKRAQLELEEDAKIKACSVHRKGKSTVPGTKNVFNRLYAQAKPSGNDADGEMAAKSPGAEAPQSHRSVTEEVFAQLGLSMDPDLFDEPDCGGSVSSRAPAGADRQTTRQQSQQSGVASRGGSTMSTSERKAAKIAATAQAAAACGAQAAAVAAAAAARAQAGDAIQPQHQPGVAPLAATQQQNRGRRNSSGAMPPKMSMNSSQCTPAVGRSRRSSHSSQPSEAFDAMFGKAALFPDLGSGEIPSSSSWDKIYEEFVEEPSVAPRLSQRRCSGASFFEEIERRTSRAEHGAATPRMSTNTSCRSSASGAGLRQPRAATGMRKVPSETSQRTSIACEASQKAPSTSAASTATPSSSVGQRVEADEEPNATSHVPRRASLQEALAAASARLQAAQPAHVAQADEDASVRSPAAARTPGFGDGFETSGCSAAESRVAPPVHSGRRSFCGNTCVKRKGSLSKNAVLQGLLAAKSCAADAFLDDETPLAGTSAFLPPSRRSSVR